jgi:hypothetical protein
VHEADRCTNVSSECEFYVKSMSLMLIRLQAQIVFFCLVALLREFSQRNNLVQVLLTLYMYTAGLQRQGFGILGHIGFGVSYTLLVSGLGTSTSWKHRKPGKESSDLDKATSERKKGPTAGPLKTLSTECMQQIKEIVKSGTPIGFVFDNINLMFKVAESSLGKIGEHFNWISYLIESLKTHF